MCTSLSLFSEFDFSEFVFSEYSVFWKKYIAMFGSRVLIGLIGGAATASLVYWYRRQNDGEEKDDETCVEVSKCGGSGDLNTNTSFEEKIEHDKSKTPQIDSSKPSAILKSAKKVEISKLKTDRNRNNLNAKPVKVKIPQDQEPVVEMNDSDGLLETESVLPSEKKTSKHAEQKKPNKSSAKKKKNRRLRM